jgi:hypothetical protein
MADDPMADNKEKFHQDMAPRAMLGDNANTGTVLMIAWAGLGILVFGGFFAWLLD